jgi:AAT family amino acid transporter
MEITMTESNQTSNRDSQPYRLPWYLFGLANLAIVLSFSLVFWYLLIDPVVSPVGLYPEPFLVVLFWSILSVVFLGFNLEFYGFEKLRQPLRGIVLIGTAITLAIAITALLTLGLGWYNPSFSASRPEGLGFVSAELYVLIGFFTYLSLVINWGHWPWKHLGLRQPWLGITEILSTTALTLIIYIVLVLPNIAIWAEAGNNVLELTTTIGWFYSRHRIGCSHRTTHRQLALETGRTRRAHGSCLASR